VAVTPLEKDPAGELTVWRYGTLVTDSAYAAAPRSLAINRGKIFRPPVYGPEFPVESDRIATTAVVIFYNDRVVKALYADDDRVPILPIVSTSERLSNGQDTEIFRRVAALSAALALSPDQQVEIRGFLKAHILEEQRLRTAANLSASQLTAELQTLNSETERLLKTSLTARQRELYENDAAGDLKKLSV
jgi:hypothetical protein